MEPIFVILQYVVNCYSLRGLTTYLSEWFAFDKLVEWEGWLGQADGRAKWIS